MILRILRFYSAIAMTLFYFYLIYSFSVTNGRESIGYVILILAPVTWYVLEEGKRDLTNKN